MGYLAAVLVVAVPTGFAVVAPHGSVLLARASFLLGIVVNDAPFYPALWLVGWTVVAAADGTLATVPGVVGAVLATPALVGLVVLLGRGLAARGVLARALADAGLPDAGARLRGPATLGRALLALVAPVVLPTRRSARGVAYGPGARNLLDVYRPHRPDRPGTRNGPDGARVLVYFHGGGYLSGRRDREGRLLLQRLARRGWLCVSAGYRLRPEAGLTEHLADLEAVLAWVAEHAGEHGGDGRRVVLAGSSAGAHLASVGALSRAPSSVAAVVGLYGYYGGYYGTARHGGRPTSPIELVTADAPPFVIVHGARDTYVSPDGARRLADSLRAVSRAPVVHAELPGAQHGFDVFRSPRLSAVVDAVAAALDDLAPGVGG